MLHNKYSIPSNITHPPRFWDQKYQIQIPKIHNLSLKTQYCHFTYNCGMYIPLSDDKH